MLNFARTIVTTAAFLAFALPATVFAQDSGLKPEDDVLRIDTQLVDVPVSVIDGSGRPVTGLGPMNFEIYEDGKLQEIASFSATDEPFEVALLLDTSGSTRADLELIVRAAEYFIGSLRPGDRVAIVAFNQRADGRVVEAYPEILSGLTGDRIQLKQSLARIGTSSGTPFYDGLLQVAEEVFGEKPEKRFRGRRALVALTDGVDSTSFWDYDRAAKLLLRSGAAAYFIRIDTQEAFERNLLGDCSTATHFSPSQIRRYYDLFPKNSGMEKIYDFCKIGDFSRLDMSKSLYKLAKEEMAEIAGKSGGRVFQAADVRDAALAFREVAMEIGTKYSVGYYSSNDRRDGSYRRITVKLKGLPKGTDVRAREGYSAPEN